MNFSLKKDAVLRSKLQIVSKVDSVLTFFIIKTISSILRFCDFYFILETIIPCEIKLFQFFQMLFNIQLHFDNVLWNPRSHLKTLLMISKFRYWTPKKIPTNLKQNLKGKNSCVWMMNFVNFLISTFNS